jgi:DNA replication protein DnaC
MSFSDIDLTEAEKQACFAKACEKKSRTVFQNKYSEYLKNGIGHIQACEMAERLSRVAQVTKEEIEEYLELAKEEKFYIRKTAEYFQRISKDSKKEITRGEYLEICLSRLKALAGDSCQITKDYNAIFSYFYGDTDTLDKKKGLLLMGNIGCGKTTLMRVFRDNSNPYKIVSCKDVSDIWKKEGDISSFCRLDKGKSYYKSVFGIRDTGICFDDLGIETRTRNYGDESNVMEDVILSWYNTGLFNRIHITTNLTVDEIEVKYGKRVRSKMREMFNLVIIEGGDRRK